MPYIKLEDREFIDSKIKDLVHDISYSNWRDGEEVGCLNYVITKLLLGVYQLKYDDPRYKHINSIIGILECCKQEMYRRVATPYEDLAKRTNSDVPEFQEWGEL